jgi:hypothetical protein
MFLCRLAVVCALSILTLNGVLAQTAPAISQPYAPSPGQGGKDVIWLPTAQGLVDQMLDMAQVTKDDYLIDLGSGDGRTVISAAKRGVRAHGIEYNPDLVAFSRQAAQAEKVGALATFEHADIFETDFSNATVVTLFLLPHLNLKLRPTLLKMKPGTRVVSNSFDMGDWQPDERAEATGECKNYCRAMKWIVPAAVEGSWRFGDGELKLAQTYQMLSGTLTRGGNALPISEAKMNGAEITFVAGGLHYAGRVIDNTMSGTAGRETWSATRSGR